MSQNIIIRASAGSGKTYQLSNRYLDLAYRGAPLDAVLASTFTRKAAGEILDRILQRLSEAALDEKKRGELSKTLYGNEGRIITEAQSLDILAETIHQLHRLRIGTLDSFFIQIAGSFSLELGIPPGWSIVDELENQRYLGEAIRSVFSQTHTDDAVRMMQLLFKGEAKRSLTTEVFDLAENLLQLYRIAPRDAWNKLAKLTPLTPEEILENHARFANYPMPSNKNVVKGRDSGAQRFLDGDWEGFLSSGFAAKIIDCSGKYYSYVFDNELLEILENLVAHARAELVNRLAIQTETTGALLERISEEYERIKNENRSLRFEDVTFRLNDSQLQHRLEQIVHRIDAPTQHLLLDEFQDTSPMQWEVLRPFVDEVIQSSLKKLQQSDGSFFCVGDTKQAIYGWRGGVAEIFDMIEKEVQPLEIQQLNTSWRSAPAVIETVNDLFHNLKANPALQDEVYADAANAWQERFEDHRTAKEKYEGFCTIEIPPIYDPETLEQTHPELAEIMEKVNPAESNDEEGEEDDSPKTPSPQTMLQKELNLQFTVQRIAQLHRESPWATIGVLTRRNHTVGQLIRVLKRHGIPASEEGGNPLTDSPAVEIVLSALILADHPGDTIRRFHLANSPLAQTLGITDAKNDSQALEASRNIRQTLFKKGYGLVLSEWIEKLAPSCDRRNLDRLLQLLQLAYSWDERFSVRADRFVEMVRTTRVESPSGSKIRVMNIHQSKGLQFDIVVLPELQGKLVGQPSKVLIGRERKGKSNKNQPDPTAPIERIIRYPNSTERALLPEVYQQMHDEDQIAKIEESLCLLYVAMTRAIHRLCMIVPPARLKKDGTCTVTKTFDAMLRWALPEDGAPGIPGTTLYAHGNPRWYEAPGSVDVTKENVTESPKEARPESVSAIRLNKNLPQKRNFKRLSPSQLEGTATIPVKPNTEKIVTPKENLVTLAEKMAENRKKRNTGMIRGTAIHACFEKGLVHTPWLDEGNPDPSDLRQIVQEIVIANRHEEIRPEEVVSSFLEICEKPAIRAALSRSHYRRLRSGAGEVQWRVHPERNFILRCEEGILRGSIDRLVVLYENGVPVEAEVTDFKTDSFREESGLDLETFLAEKTAFYAPQLSAYRAAVARLYRLDPKLIRTQLLFTSLDRVVIP